MKKRIIEVVFLVVFVFMSSNTILTVKATPNVDTYVSRSPNDVTRFLESNLNEEIFFSVIETGVPSREKDEDIASPSYVMYKDKDGHWNPASPATSLEHALSVDNSSVDMSKPRYSDSWDKNSQLQDRPLLDRENSRLESMTISPASSSTTLFTENFEGDFPSTNWWVGDDDSNNGADYWDDTSHRSYSGSWSGWCADIGSKPDGTPNTADWTYDDYMGAYLSRRAGAPFDARYWDIAFLTYRVWYDIESGYDELDLSVTGDGTNWGGIFQYDSNSLTSGDWYLDGSSGGAFEYRVGRVPEITSAGSVYTSSFNIGFYFQSDGSIHKEGAYLDDISFTVYDITSGYVGVSKSTASPGDTIELGYKIDNISPFDLKIWLGATLTDQYGNQINDPANDVIRTVTPGYQWYYRNFHIPNSANPGTYDITYALWSGWTSPIDQSRQWWTWTWNDVLTIEPLNYAPDLSDGYVDPNPGYIDTNFKFLVKYTDQNGDPAVVRKIYVQDSGGWLDFDMDHLAGNPTVGEWFIVWLSGFAREPHSFYFYFTDGELSDRDPISGYYSFDVVNRVPTVSDGYVNPVSGFPDTEFTFRVKYTDQDGDPASTKRLILDDDGIFYFDMYHLSGDPLSGEWFEVQVTGLHPDSEVGQHRFFFYFTDSKGSEDYDPDDGWHLGPTVELGGRPKIRVEPTSLVFDWYLAGTSGFESTLPLSTDNEQWWNDWSRDKNKNKIDDILEELSVFSTNTNYNIFVNYDWHPTQMDMSLLDSWVGISHVYNNFDMIAANNVSMSTIKDHLIELPHVVMIDWQGPPIRGMLDVSTKSIKASPSSLYSPNTAWERGYTGEGINVVILDSGVDDEHESFTGKFIAGYNAITNVEENPDDITGHGTHVAGIVLGTGGTSQTYRGVSPDAKLIDVKVVTGPLPGSGTSADLIRGIDWCISHKDTYNIHIISISIGVRLTNSDGTDEMSRAVNRAVDEGIVVVVSAGNDGPGRYIGPIAAADKAITVAAIDDYNTIDRSDDVIASFSSRGPRDNDGDSDPYDELKPDISAPGVGILSAKLDTSNQYWSMSGTSMAAPHISGVVALMLERNPSLTSSQIKHILHNTAEDRDGTYDPTLDAKYDVAYGWGEVDAFSSALSIVYQTLKTYNDGDANLVVSSIASNPAWLSASPTSFTLAPGASQDVITAVDPSGLSIGTYFGTLEIISNDAYGNDHFNVDVTLNIIDKVPPPIPVVSSPTHPYEERWYSNNDPQFDWTIPEDPSGIKGYSYIIDHSPSTTPDTTVGTPGNSASYSDLADGEWWFHVRAVDNADNWGSADHYRIGVDTTSPTITSHTPTGTEVPVTTAITIVFSEAMNHASAENAFSISSSVSGSFSWSANTMTFTPDSALAYGTTYEVTINTGSMDLAGNHLQSTYNWQFTTEVRCEVIFYTDPSGSGFNITFMGQTYHNDTKATFPFETSGLATANAPIGWTFDHWVVTDNIQVSNTTDNPTTVTITCGGSLKAVYARPFDFSISASPIKRTIVAGTSTTYTVAVKLKSGTTKLVTLTVSDLPSGATATFSPESGYPYFTSTLAITTSTSTPSGIYTLTITASGGGVTHSRTVQLTVKPKITSFTVSPNRFSPNGDGRKDNTTIKASFTETVSWTLEVKNSTNHIIRTWAGTGSSLQTLWDGRNSSGIKVPDGTYTIVLAGNSLSSGIPLVWNGTRAVIVDTTRPIVTCSWNPNPFNPHIGENSTCTYTLSEKCAVFIKIYDSKGKLVKTLLAWTTKDAGTYTITWDGKNNAGAIGAAGTYICRIYATDMAGNQVSPTGYQTCTIQVL